jgi:hypothetical protein
MKLEFSLGNILTMVALAIGGVTLVNNVSAQVAYQGEIIAQMQQALASIDARQRQGEQTLTEIVTELRLQRDGRRAGVE